jgi:hypothetical protein
MVLGRFLSGSEKRGPPGPSSKNSPRPAKMIAYHVLHGSHKYFLFMNNTMVAMNIYYYHSVIVTIMVVVIIC